jgi:two-component system cell cycle response regulator DivK
MVNEPPLILYVEDNPHNMLLVQRLLRAEGFRVDGASSAEEAETYLKSHKPNLILMDINLPRIDGYTLTAKFKKLRGLESVPIIALTANALKGDEDKSFAAGCNGYIQKPIDVDTLPELIRGFLENAEA